MKIFLKDENIVRGINSLYESLKDAPYGTTYTWDEISSMTGLVNISKQKLYYIGSHVNELLLSESKYLETVFGVGKKLLNPHEHRISARKQVKRSAKIYKKAGSILSATNLDAIESVDERQKVISDANKFRTMELLHDVMLKKDRKKIGNASEKVFFDLVGFLKGDN